MNNEPQLWIKDIPCPKDSDHKYSRGQVIVMGGVDMTGAACLSADAAARVGAGLVTLISPKVHKGSFDPVLVYKCFKPYIIARNDISMQDCVYKAQKKGVVCPVIGPGLGDKDYQGISGLILTLLEDEQPIVIDADGLNAFQINREAFWLKTHGKVVLTPHEGEFKKLFPDLAPLLKDDRSETARAASERSGAVLVLKGAQTVIADPAGQVVTNSNASPYLATGGSGDVLSGMVAGLIAQGMTPFNAACAAVWMHGHASEIIGAGLVASDIIEKIPELLKEMLGIQKKVG